MASSVSNLAIPQGVIAFGEVGLAGEVRPVAGVPRRITEAERMGFRRAIVPAGGSAETLRDGVHGEDGDAAGSRRRGGTGRIVKATPASGGIEVVEVEDVAAAVQAALLD
jgi:DNA repair protein RadA/Sms